MSSRDHRRAWRERQLRARDQSFHADVAQGPLEGFILVRPDGSLTAEVVHVQWMDNHPSGPDTHAMVSFADHSNVEFDFDTPVVKALPGIAGAVDPGDVRAAAPSLWGRDAAPWA